ncbi:glycoside hydrolase family 25 protein [Heyndrickxia sp. NPDC080065]|uniref:glycoside hydrolase family 25 protein n=1 Tax=Heyndrickxia sp. NPDC080065 TaxID=3390568 RepID=UPI003D08AB14
MKWIDISHYQNESGKIDWNKVKADGVEGVMVKATEGITWTDKYFYENVKDARSAGLYVGAYHYTYADTVEIAEKEAAFFLNYIKGLKLDVVSLDAEYPKAKGNLSVVINAFMGRIKDRANKVWLYTYPYWAKDHLDKSVTKWDLWIAHYGVDKPTLFYWDKYVAWQYTSTGKINGIVGEVDVNKVLVGFQGSSNPPINNNDMYKVNKAVSGYFTAADAKAKKNKMTTVKPGTYYVYNKSAGMINVTTQKGVPGSWINPADNK